MAKYFIAFTLESGNWDIVEEFEAADNFDAEKYAEGHYDRKEWYVLDAQKENINAW